MKLIVDTKEESVTKIVSGSSLESLSSGKTIQCFDDIAQRHVYIGLIRGEIVILHSCEKMICEYGRSCNGIATKNVDQPAV